MRFHWTLCLKGLPPVLVEPSREEITKEEEGAQTKFDLGTLGKAAGFQALTKGSAINPDRSLIEPTLSIRHRDSMHSMALPPSSSLIHLPSPLPLSLPSLKAGFCTDADGACGFSGCWIMLQGPFGEKALLPLLPLIPLTCVNELGLSLECSIELCPTP